MVTTKDIISKLDTVIKAGIKDEFGYNIDPIVEKAISEVRKLINHWDFANQDKIETAMVLQVHIMVNSKRASKSFDEYISGKSKDFDKSQYRALVVHISGLEKKRDKLIAEINGNDYIKKSSYRLITGD